MNCVNPFCEKQLTPSQEKYWMDIYQRDETSIEDQEFHTCRECMEADIASETRSLEQAESGAGWEKIRDDEFHRKFSS